MDAEQKTRQIFKQLGKIAGWNPPQDTKFVDQKNEMIRDVESEMPSGSGIDAGCKFNYDKSKENFIVIDFGYHHMDENGFYAGWFCVELTLIPSFINDFRMDFEIVGNDTDISNNDIRELYFDCLYHLFDYDLKKLMEVSH